MGLPPGTAAAAADSFVWMAEQDELAAERVLMLMRLLGGGGVPARAVGGAVRELQRYVGCGQPVLETKHMKCRCAQEDWTECIGRCSEAKQGSAGKGRCESTCGWNGTWLGMLYRQLSNSRLSLTGGRGMPCLRNGDEFLVDLVEGSEVEMIREGCRAAGVWRVSELRGLDGTELRESAQAGGALERLAGRGKTGAQWGAVVRRVAHGKGRRYDEVGKRVKLGAGSKCGMKLGSWDRKAVCDWGLAAWAEGGRVMLGVPQSGPGCETLECRILQRVEDPTPKWRKLGSERRKLRRQVWKVGEKVKVVNMVVVKDWDQYTERHRVLSGGVWPLEASCVVEDGEEKWMIDELPADLSEQIFMQQRDMGVEHREEWQQEWRCSGWRPGLGEEQEEQVCWEGGPWEQPNEEEGFAPGAEEKLLGEGGSSMRRDTRWRQKLNSGRKDGRWGVLDVYSDGGADGAGTPEATAEYGWLVGGTDEDALEIWAQGAARVGAWAA